MDNILELDRRHAWHPFTQHATETAPAVISHAKDAVMYRPDGREILDLISSWWTCLHAHSHPAINKALSDQAEKAPHVMFAAFTHEPAVSLATKLSSILPDDLNRVFFSDDGSTSVEVALKMAYQYWANKGEPQRKTFLTFKGAYHGDTLGAMSVGKESGFFNLFEDMMCSIIAAPYVGTWIGDEDVDDREARALGELEVLLAKNKGQICAMIIEPLMQGASGMNFCRPDFLKAVVDMARQAGILVIFDEVATGFGRTGTMFACEQADLTPDIICLSKGLTAGYMAMSVTVARDSVYDVFLGEDFNKALAHGHSFTANPLACAVALKSLELFEEEKTMERIQRINTKHQQFAERLMSVPQVDKPRVLGTIVACNFVGDTGYKSNRSVQLRDWYLEQGFNIRPIGSTLYMMPPYCITDEQLDASYNKCVEGLEKIIG